MLVERPIELAVCLDIDEGWPRPNPIFVRLSVLRIFTYVYRFPVWSCPCRLNRKHGLSMPLGLGIRGGDGVLFNCSTRNTQLFADAAIIDRREYRNACVW
jgi:hypothetical protein